MVSLCRSIELWRAQFVNERLCGLAWLARLLSRQQRSRSVWVAVAEMNPRQPARDRVKSLLRSENSPRRSRPSTGSTPTNSNCPTTSTPPPIGESAKERRSSRSVLECGSRTFGGTAHSHHRDDGQEWRCSYDVSFPARELIWYWNDQSALLSLSKNISKYLA